MQNSSCNRWKAKGHFLKAKKDVQSNIHPKSDTNCERNGISGHEAIFRRKDFSRLKTFKVQHDERKSYGTMSLNVIIFTKIFLFIYFCCARMSGGREEEKKGKLARRKRLHVRRSGWVKLSDGSVMVSWSISSNKCRACGEKQPALGNTRTCLWTDCDSSSCSFGKRKKKKKKGLSDENFSFFRRDITTPRTRYGIKSRSARWRRDTYSTASAKARWFLTKGCFNIGCKSENRFSCALKQSAAELSAPFRRMHEKEIEHRLSCYARSLLWDGEDAEVMQDSRALL